MSEELVRFLEHVDNILELAKPVYQAGEGAAIYFRLLNKFNISEEEGLELQAEIMKRDIETPSISYYQNKVYTVIVSCPWILSSDGNVIRPEIDLEGKECSVNAM